MNPMVVLKNIRRLGILVHKRLMSEEISSSTGKLWARKPRAYISVWAPCVISCAHASPRPTSSTRRSGRTS